MLPVCKLEMVIGKQRMSRKRRICRRMEKSRREQLRRRLELEQRKKMNHSLRKRKRHHCKQMTCRLTMELCSLVCIQQMERRQMKSKIQKHKRICMA